MNRVRVKYKLMLWKGIKIEFQRRNIQGKTKQLLLMPRDVGIPIDTFNEIIVNLIYNNKWNLLPFDVVRTECSGGDGYVS